MGKIKKNSAWIIAYLLLGCVLLWLHNPSKANAGTCIQGRGGTLYITGRSALQAYCSSCGVYVYICSIAGEGCLWLDDYTCGGDEM
jgi:hypothetical protein